MYKAFEVPTIGVFSVWYPDLLEKTVTVALAAFPNPLTVIVWFPVNVVGLTDPALVITSHV